MSMKILNLIHVMNGLIAIGIQPDPDDDYLIDKALHDKTLRIAQWLWEHGCRLRSFHMTLAFEASTPFDPSFARLMIENGCPIHPHTVATAASKGRLDIVRWWHEQGYPFCDSAPAWAAIWGHIHIVRFLIDNKKPISPGWTAANASQSKNTAIIRLLRDRGLL